jgi:hypothetical protein
MVKRFFGKKDAMYARLFKSQAIFCCYNWGYAGKQLLIRSVHTPFRKQTDKSCLCEKTNDFLRYYVAHNLQLLMVGFIHLNNISVLVAPW